MNFIIQRAYQKTELLNKIFNNTDAEFRKHT